MLRVQYNANITIEDEDMFAVIDKSNPSFYSVVVKRKPSQAKAYHFVLL